MRRVRSWIAFAAILAVLGCTPAGTQTAKPGPASGEEPTKRCLNVARIYRTETPDDSTILFHMRDGAVWKNELTNPCYGLRMQGGFGFMSALDRVCDLDLIQILGPSRSVCGLGRFEAYEPPLGPGANAYDAD